jgi:hypothetical protein
VAVNLQPCAAQVLSKTYYFMEDDFNSDMVLDRAEGCVIQWATPEANLTKTKTRKQSKNKSMPSSVIPASLVHWEAFWCSDIQHPYWL